MFFFFNLSLYWAVVKFEVKWSGVKLLLAGLLLFVWSSL